MVLKGGNTDSVGPRVQVGAQECEHLCVGAVHVPAGDVWDVQAVLQCRVSRGCVCEPVPC